MGKNQNHKVAAPRQWFTYPQTRGNVVTLYALGSDDAAGSGGAFHDLAEAIKAATTFIFIVDWSFQPYVRLGPRSATPSLSDTVGGLLVDRANHGVLVAIHAWDHATAVGDDQNNDADARIREIATSLGANMGYQSNLLFRKTSRGTLSYWSNHQKFVVLDADGGGGKRVVKAFFGGLDLTKGRFDWSERPFLHSDPKAWPLTPRITNGGRWYDDWYNAEFTTKNPKEEQPGDVNMPRQCWEDFYGSIVGPSAWDVVREFVGRWNKTDGGTGHTDDASRNQVEDLFKDMFGPSSPFKKEWEDHGGPLAARVVRSIKKDGWGQNTKAGRFYGSDPKPLDTLTADGKTTKREFDWVVTGETELSIQVAYLNAIAMAKDFVYVETQYFIGSGSTWTPAHGGVKNRIPETITKRIADKIKAGEDFHAYVVIPMFPEGDPVSQVAHLQRQFEFQTMGAMANGVVKALKDNNSSKKWTDYLSFYFLMNWTAASMTPDGSRRDRVQKNQRYQIYVHSKLLIVDDKVLILGSANLNERSLSGDRDAEICLALAAQPDKIDDAKAVIQGLRRKVWTQHFGVLPAGWDTPHTGGCPVLCQQQGHENWMFLQQGLKTNDSHIVCFPFATDGTTFRIDPPSATALLQQQDRYLFDAEAKPTKVPGNGVIIDDKWLWDPPGWVPMPDALAE